jgi:hypothetical protein
MTCAKSLRFLSTSSLSLHNNILTTTGRSHFRTHGDNYALYLCYVLTVERRNSQAPPHIVWYHHWKHVRPALTAKHRSAMSPGASPQYRHAAPRLILCMPLVVLFDLTPTAGCKNMMAFPVVSAYCKEVLILVLCSSDLRF